MDPAPSYEAALLRVVFTLAALCAGAWWFTRIASRKGLARTRGSHLEVIERVPLDGRQTLYLVRVAGKVLLLGGGDAGLTTLATLDADALAESAREGTTPS
jgi:flagellar biosynthetic protein FliO